MDSHNSILKDITSLFLSLETNPSPNNMSSISYNSPDAADNKTDNFEVLVQKINEFHSKHIGDPSIRPGIRLNDFNVKLDGLQEYAYEINGTLNLYHFSTHKVLWLLSMKSLLEQLVNYVTYFDTNVLKSACEAPNHLIEVIDKKLNKLVDDYSKLRFRFLSSVSVSDYLYNGLFEPFLSLISSTLELLLIDRTNLEVLKPLQIILLDYFALILKPKYKPDYHFIVGQFFPILTQYSKVVYEVGESGLFAPFISNKHVNPYLPIMLIQKTSVNFVDLISFLKYAAFNLVELSIMENLGSITEQYNHDANIYFKMLLSFPNLNTSLYESAHAKKISQPDESQGYANFVLKSEKSASNTEESVVNLQERQEISMVFLLNYLLKLSDMRQLVDPSTYFKKELNFLLQSLTASLSQEIHQSASQSKHSSTASFADLKMAEMQKRMETLQRERQQKNISSLSSLIIHGTYKEKLSLVVRFFELFKNFNLSSLNRLYNINQTFQAQDDVRGKKCFIHCIDSVVRLVNLLSIKFLLNSSGLNNFPEAYLNTFLGTDRQIVDILTVKSFLAFSKYEKDEVTFITLRPLPTTKFTKDMISSQVEISKVSKKLQSVSFDLLEI